MTSSLVPRPVANSISVNRHVWHDNEWQRIDMIAQTDWTPRLAFQNVNQQSLGCYDAFKQVSVQCASFICLFSLLLKLSSGVFQVGEITKIMKAYINMIVKKRCSVRSGPSYGTNWIRWLGTGHSPVGFLPPLTRRLQGSRVHEDRTVLLNSDVWITESRLLFSYSRTRPTPGVPQCGTPSQHSRTC